MLTGVAGLGGLLWRGDRPLAVAFEFFEGKRCGVGGFALTSSFGNVDLSISIFSLLLLCREFFYDDEEEKKIRVLARDYFGIRSFLSSVSAL